MIEYTVKVYENGSKYWYLNDKLHREDGPAIEYAGGTKAWWLNGELHRVGGPAVEYDYGTKFWYLYGKLHREDGPAFEGANGSKEWYLNGYRVTEGEHKRRTSKATCSGKVVKIDGIEYELKEL